MQQLSVQGTHPRGFVQLVSASRPLCVRRGEGSWMVCPMWAGLDVVFQKYAKLNSVRHVGFHSFRRLRCRCTTWCGC